MRIQELKKKKFVNTFLTIFFLVFQIMQPTNIILCIYKDSVEICVCRYFSLLKSLWVLAVSGDGRLLRTSAIRSIGKTRG